MSPLRSCLDSLDVAGVLKHIDEQAKKTDTQRGAKAAFDYILRRFTTGRLTDETHWLPNKEMTKLSEISDETSTKLFAYFQCQTLQCDTSTARLSR